MQANSKRRVIRGGAWSFARHSASATSRHKLNPDNAYLYAGFRVVKQSKNNDCAYRMIRGGSWLSSALSCHSAYRGRGAPGARSGLIGFRVIKK